MATKLTILFNGTTSDQELVWGFSETWYTVNTGDAAIDLWRRRVAGPRATCLAHGTAIIGYRVQSAVAGARAYTVREPGDYEGPMENGPANVPQDAALCQVFGQAGGAVKRFWVHCLPDAWVSDGGFNENVGATAKITTFVRELVTAGFQFRYLLQTAPSSPCLSIDVNGRVQTVAGVAGAVQGAQVQFVRMRDTLGHPVKGIYRISNAGYTSPSDFTVLNYKNAAVVNSGVVRLVQYNFTACNPPAAGKGQIAAPVLRPGVRKCGRPFFQLRGRASTRR